MKTNSRKPKRPAEAKTTRTAKRKGDYVQRRVRRWRSAVPDSEGWWLWREDHDRDRTERLLIVCGSRHSEVAGDDEWEEATGEKAEHDGFVENYWEGTDTKTMGGYWMKESPNAKPCHGANQK